MTDYKEFPATLKVNATRNNETLIKWYSIEDMAVPTVKDRNTLKAMNSYIFDALAMGYEVQIRK